jgi:hypothetical protein
MVYSVTNPYFDYEKSVKTIYQIQDISIIYLFVVAKFEI